MLRAIALLGAAGRAFQAPTLGVAASLSQRAAAATSAEMTDVALENPTCRDRDYADNAARYLVDLHEKKAVFDFCGGMMFQLALSPKLRSHLETVAKGDGKQPVIYDASKPRMAQIPGYSKDASADMVSVFHGREVRQVADAAGGMGMVLQLSHTDDDDPEGWTGEEVDEYAGWLSDRQRRWRDGPILIEEGFEAFRERFGPEAFTLHHRFYLHVDDADEFWLSAEDGCEGVAQKARPRERDFGAAARSLFR